MNIDVRVSVLERQVSILTESVKAIETFVSKAKLAFAAAVGALIGAMFLTGSGTISLKSLIEWFGR